MEVPYVQEETPECIFVFGPKKTAKITGIQGKIFSLLWENLGKGVTADRIVTRIWEYDPPDGYLSTLKVHKHKLKMSLVDTGLTVVCVNKARYHDNFYAEGTVYCLVPEDSQAAASWGIKNDKNAALLKAMEIVNG